MTFQERAFALIEPTWHDDAGRLVAECETRRPPKNTTTGTMSQAASAYLRAVTALVRPAVIVEVGTFIGTSILSMRATKHKYTCDSKNALLESGTGLTAYPKTTSTAMFRDLVSKEVIADFMFFDGRAQDEDFALIHQLVRPGTIYGFDDFEGQEKGVWNVRRFLPLLPNHVLIGPPKKVPYVKGDTTIALLVPRSLA